MFKKINILNIILILSFLILYLFNLKIKNIKRKKIENFNDPTYPNTTRLTSLITKDICTSTDCSDIKDNITFTTNVSLLDNANLISTGEAIGVPIGTIITYIPINKNILYQKMNITNTEIKALIPLTLSGDDLQNLSGLTDKVITITSSVDDISLKINTSNIGPLSAGVPYKISPLNSITSITISANNSILVETFDIVIEAPIITAPYPDKNELTLANLQADPKLDHTKLYGYKDDGTLDQTLKWYPCIGTPEGTITNSSNKKITIPDLRDKMSFGYSSDPNVIEFKNTNPENLPPLPVHLHYFDGIKEPYGIETPYHNFSRVVGKKKRYGISTNENYGQSGNIPLNITSASPTNTDHPLLKTGTDSNNFPTYTETITNDDSKSKWKTYGADANIPPSFVVSSWIRIN